MESKKYGILNAIELNDPIIQLKNTNKRIYEWSEGLLLKISKYKEKYMTKKEGKG